MNTVRLIILAKHLEHIAELEKCAPQDLERHFDMGCWWFKGVDANCATAACAMGEATTIPEFATAGLSLSFLSNESLSGTPIFELSQGFYAAALFFDISVKSAVYLFDPVEYGAVNRICPEDVAGRIRRFIFEN